jgi:hypothetical protein
MSVQSTQQNIPVTSFFPLYDLLLSQVNAASDKNVPLTEDEIKKLIIDISSMDKIGSDMIYVWIRLHSLRNSHTKLLDTPYGGQKLDSKIQENDIVCDVKFDLRVFPCILQKMLQRFTLLHLRKMSEDSNRKLVG